MNPETEAIEAAAAAWLGRCGGGLTASEEAEFAAWMEGDARRAAAFERLEAASRALDRLSALRARGQGAIDAEIRVFAARRRHAWIPVALAFAAALAVATDMGWRARRAGATFSETASSTVGRLRALPLPDGSNIELNTDSAVDIRFTRAERRVCLERGEALFTVARNPTRPFVVSAGGVLVRAVGTAFNVRLRKESVEVLVTEGRVGVVDPRNGESLLAASAGEKPALLSAGRRALFAAPPSGSESPAGAVVEPVSPEGISHQLAWQHMRLEFDPMPLSEWAAEFNRYNARKLVIADASVGALSIGGSFRADDDEAFVRLLVSGFRVAAERRPGEILLRSAAPTGKNQGRP